MAMVMTTMAMTVAMTAVTRRRLAMKMGVVDPPHLPIYAPLTTTDRGPSSQPVPSAGDLSTALTSSRAMRM